MKLGWVAAFGAALVVEAALAFLGAAVLEADMVGCEMDI